MLEDYYGYPLLRLYTLIKEFDMYIRVRKLAAKVPEQDIVITISKITDIREIREKIQKKLGVDPKLQKLYYKGKQLMNGSRVIDYNIGLNDVLQLTILNPTDSETPSGSTKVAEDSNGTDTHKENTDMIFDSEDDEGVIRCERCSDAPNVPCAECSCFVCESKLFPNKIVLCDECDNGYHVWCLSPPLSKVPSATEWYCPKCKTKVDEIIKDGEGPIVSKKKAKMLSTTSKKLNWGQGMACVGKSTNCSIVPVNHFGPVPGVDVGTTWKYRMQVAEAGVHRPPVAGIHGRETDGAYSIILSGGYEDDFDMGDEFVYTGSGGRDYSGNKRQAEQSSDQKLVRMNKALALNCNAKLNVTIGTQSKNWRKGKPVRVVRNYKLNKTSAFGPKEGNRYDGIYKVFSYSKDMGKAGFYVWKFVLRRDDKAPAPWDDDGHELAMIYPPGYLDAQKEKEESASKKKGKGKKSGNNSDAESKALEEVKKEDEEELPKTPEKEEMSDANLDVLFHSPGKINQNEVKLEEPTESPKPPKKSEEDDVESTFKSCKALRKYANKMKGKKPLVRQSSVSSSTACATVTSGAYDMECASSSKGILKTGPSKYAEVPPQLKKIVCFSDEFGERIMPHLELQEFRRSTAISERKTILEHYESVKSPIPKHGSSESNPVKQPLKRIKVEPIEYTLPPRLHELIELDTRNKKKWDECAPFLRSGKIIYLEKVTEQFTCVNCRDLVCKPLTTKCGHNLCCECMRQAFVHNFYTCPNCRSHLGRNYALRANSALTAILESLFPGYESHRE